MQQRSLGKQGLKVSPLGLGCMAMTPLYDAPDPEEAIRTIHADQIGRAHVSTPVTNAHLVCRPLLEKKKELLAGKFQERNYTFSEQFNDSVGTALTISAVHVQCYLYYLDTAFISL